MPRPELPKKRVRFRRLSIPLRSDELRMLRVWAKSSKMTLAEWARKQLLP